MPKFVAAGLAALFIGAAPVHAQTLAAQAAQTGTGLEDLKAATETRIEITKVALQLTPAQEKLWPAIEEAIRARATARQQRLLALSKRLNDSGEANPSEVLQQRAEALTQRGATLKKLADAWQPLIATLDTKQKARVRFLVMYSLREVRDLVAAKFEEVDESEEW
jgi:ribosomal 50S subunit-associated protein YjgA (DUF615 family)